MKIAVTVALTKLIASVTLALAALANASVAHASLVVAGQSRWNATFNDDAVIDASEVRVLDQSLPHWLDGSRVANALGDWSKYCDDAACWYEFDYYDA